MNAAAFTIIWMRLLIYYWSYWSLICASAGAAFGLVFGLELLDAHISPPQVRLFP